MENRSVPNVDTGGPPTSGASHDPEGAGRKARPRERGSTRDRPIRRRASRPTGQDRTGELSTSPDVKTSGPVANAGPIRVLIVEDDLVYRDGLRQHLEPYADQVEIVGEAGTAEDAVRLVRTLSPDIVLLDLQLPAYAGVLQTPQLLQGLSVLKQIRVDAPATRVIVLTHPLQARRDNAMTLFEALRGGALGFILKPEIQTSNYLVEALHQVMQGRALLGTTVAQIMKEYLQFPAPAFPVGASSGEEARAEPTESELEELDQVARGVRAKTVNATLVRKLQASRVVEEGKWDQFLRYMNNLNPHR